MKRYSICNKFINRLCIILLAIVALVLYSFTLFTSGIEIINNPSGNQSDIPRRACVTKEKWFDFVKLMAFIDTIITMLIPFLIIFLCNLSIIFKLRNFSINNHLPRLKASFYVRI